MTPGYRSATRTGNGSRLSVGDSDRRWLPAIGRVADLKQGPAGRRRLAGRMPYDPRV